MSGLKRSLLAAVFCAALAAPAAAQIGGHPLEASLGAGITSFDARDRIQDAPGAVGSLGWRWTPTLTFEAAWHVSMTKLDEPNEADHTFSWAGADIRWTLRDPSGRAVPYFLTGLGFGRVVDDDRGITERGSPSLGLGLLVNLFGNPRTHLRLQARDMMFREGDATGFSNHIAATAAVQFAFGGKAKDQDLDGVRDWLDRCPNTPIGAKVGKDGCPVDSDRDSVYDGLDQCEGTPFGCKVDKNGCPTDRDGDKVCDGLDQCADTPKGAVVDAKGCPVDTDGDGVFDGLDQCANTPKGAVVDAQGCPVDTDGDGVADGLDQCPNTPAGLKVDPNGCPIEVSEKETQLLDAGVIRIQNINFDVNKASIKPESFAVIDTVASILLQYPTLEIEIGGHTDNSGSKALNDKLSDARAKSVMGYLAQKYPTLDATHFTAKGYGSNAPVASNATKLGKAQNRRVEFKVMNAEALKVEREKRRFLRRDEAAPAPADSTKR